MYRGDPRTEHPDVRILISQARTNRVVLVLHGGTAVSQARVRSTHLAYRRMLPLARTVHRATARQGTAVWVLRNQVRGWNEPTLNPVLDALWALDVIRTAHRDVPITLVGHSMGGRVALRLGGEPGVRAICALAPWTTDSDPTRQLAGREVLIVHGDRDRVTPVESSRTYASRAHKSGAEITRHVIRGSGHAMLRHRREWSEHVRRFALASAPEGSPA